MANDAQALLGAGQVELPDRGRGPGVLLLAGAETSADARTEACRRLADNGFVAWSAELEDEPPALGEAVERLFRLDAVDGARIGVLALGSGAGRALRAAESARVGVALCLEPVAEPEALEPQKLGARVLLVCAERDPLTGSPELRALREALEGAGARVELRVLPGVEPGFLDPVQADRFDARAARLAWDAALAALRAEL